MTRTVVAIPWWIAILFFPFVLAVWFVIAAFYVIGFAILAIVKLVQYLAAQHHASQPSQN